MQLNGLTKWRRCAALAIGLTLLLMLLSTFYRIEVRHRRCNLLPCVLRIFEIPQTSISYGFPVFWLTRVEGIRQVGCGPVVGVFSTYALVGDGFLTSFIFYTFCCSLIVFLMKSRSRLE